ncbi:MAG: DUF5678 domain-containing protein [Candidatus Bathyarchaeia archaeon]
MESEQVFLDEVKKKFAGKWVGVKGMEVVAVSESHEELVRKIRRKGLDGVYIFYVPTEKEKKYEFLF